MTKTRKYIVAGLILLIFLCGAWLFNFHSRDVFRQQYDLAVEETQKAYLDFSRLALALLEDEEQVDFENFSNSYTSLMVSISQWSPLFAEAVEEKELPYDNGSPYWEGTVTEIYLDIKELYFQIIHLKYLQDNNGRPQGELLQMHKEIQEEMDCLLVKYR